MHPFLHISLASLLFPHSLYSHSFKHAFDLSHPRSLNRFVPFFFALSLTHSKRTDPSSLSPTALSAHAALLFPRQDSSSLDSVYASLESFSQEVAAKIGSGECVESDSCAGWLNGALECISGKDELAMAVCACDFQLKKSFDTCVTCAQSFPFSSIPLTKDTDGAT